MADIRCLLDLLPTINTGVVAKVVKAKKHVLDQSALQKSPAGEIPVMLETTAAVHPGGSGGAVVDSSGRLISLVTSFGFVWLLLVQKLFHLEGRRIILLLRLVDYLEKK